MAMRKLLRWKQINDLIEHPERLDVQDLLGIAHSVFTVQSVVGTVGFAAAAWHGSIGLVTIGNLVFPAVGFLHTRDNCPENFRALRFCAGYWFLGLLHTFYLAVAGWSPKALSVGALKLVLFTAQWLVLARLWRLLQDRSLQQVQFYLNVVVKNKTDVIKSQLKERHPHTGGLLGKLANKIVSDDKFAAKIAAKMVDSIPVKMNREAGLTVVATKEFQKGNFIVLRVAIEHVDVHRMVMLKGGEEKAKTVDFLLVLVSLLPRRIGKDLEHLLRGRIAQGLLRKMPEQITQQMQDVGGVEVEVEARRQDTEAEFLFAALRQLDEDGAASPAMGGARMGSV